MSKNYLDRITIEPGKCGGRPCIRGFRLRVKDVLDLLAAGASEQEAIAKKPTAEFDAAWAKGFLPPDLFTGIVYRTL